MFGILKRQCFRKSKMYNDDYTEFFYKYYQKMIFYFGFRLSW